MGVATLVLIGMGVVSVLVLGIKTYLKFRGMDHERRPHSYRGNVFQGPAEWADINEAADRPPAYTDGEEIQRTK
jgi:hypothetical protein